LPDECPHDDRWIAIAAAMTRPSFPALDHNGIEQPNWIRTGDDPQGSLKAQSRVTRPECSDFEVFHCLRVAIVVIMRLVQFPITKHVARVPRRFVDARVFTCSEQRKARRQA
jgi:hypothetical protein